MIIDLSPTAAVLVDIVAWSLLGVLTGWRNTRLSTDRLRVDGWLPPLRDWELGGWYQSRLRIKDWKDRLPEAGALFRGGVSKRKLPGHDRVGLERFAAETRRAERVHWTLLASSGLFLVWNPPGLAAVMVTYGIAANVPFIAVQRFNRARIVRILARGDASEASPGSCADVNGPADGRVGP